jgi:hypothetical protein
MATAYLDDGSVFEHTPLLPLRAAIKAAVETLVSVLDAMDGEPNKGDPFNEDEPAFDRGSRGLVKAYGNGAGCQYTDQDFGGEELGEEEPY